MEMVIEFCVRSSKAWNNIEKGLNDNISSSRVGKYFKLNERKSCFTREFRAATTTFLAMAYVITVVSTILSDTGGTCPIPSPSPEEPNMEYDNCISVVKSDLIVAISLAGMMGCFAMGLLANLPFGLAPGTVEALFFIAISATGLRSKLGRLIPPSVRLACAVGMGLFMAFVGLQSQQGVGLIGPDPSSIVRLLSLKSPTLWLGIVGFLIMSYGQAHEIKGSMIYGILFVTTVSWFRGTSVTYFPKTVDGEARYKYFKKVVDFHKIKKIAGKISLSDFSKGTTWVSLFTLLYIDILATTGTLYTLAEIGGFINDKGSFENEYIAYLIDASVTVVGSALGVPPVATYTESSTGMKEGGRTGLTAVIIGIYFFLALFFAPLLINVPPWAIGPSLVMIGVIMMRVAKDIEWSNFKEAIPAFITIILMPFTNSIPNGIIGGLGVYVVLHFHEWTAWLVKLVLKPRKKKEIESDAIRADNTSEIP
uniref:Uncharacterized protein n=1 Tax=Chenopodium quinoa TaxID=63459 RepID=A0A803MA08_CHEQI